MVQPPIFLVSTLVTLLGLGACATDVDWTTITNSRGDHLPDFSYCGYHASDDALPSIDSKATIELAVASGDQTSRIQAALDKAAAAGGGVVKLGAGQFSVSSGLVLGNGTILRGSGVGSTTLKLSKLTSGVPALSLGNGTNHRVQPSLSSSIVNDYVGIGADTVTLKSTDGFKKGQSVMVSRTASAKWIRANGMADLVRSGKQQTWIKVSKVATQRIPITVASAALRLADHLLTVPAGRNRD